MLTGERGEQVAKAFCELMPRGHNLFVVLVFDDNDEIKV